MTGSANAAPVRLTGLLYLVIIVCALFAQVVARGGVAAAGDAGATAAAIRGAEGLFRLGLVADLIAFLADTAVAVFLYVLLRPVDRTAALLAAALRLVGTAVYGANLLNHLGALLAATGGVATPAVAPGQADALALFFLELHGQGYDLGLVFFGGHCLVLGRLLGKTAGVPRVLGVLMVLAGVVYLAGSTAVFLAPGSAGALAAAYAVPLLAELALSVWLLVQGPRVLPPVAIGVA